MKLSDAVEWFGRDAPPGVLRTRRVLKIVFLLALFAALFWVVDFETVIQALSTADTRYVAVGFLLYIPVFYLNAWQLKLLAKQEGINIGVGEIVLINLSIRFYLIFVPGTLVGSGMRWYKLTQARGKPAESLAAVAFNRLLETFLIVVLGLGFWLLSGQDVMQVNALGLVVLVLITGLLWFGVTRLSSSLSNWLAPRIKGSSDHPVVHSGLQKFNKFLTVAAVYGDVPARELGLLVAIGISLNLIGLLAYQSLARSVGVMLPFTDMGWIRSVVLLLALLPFSIAGGLGIREVGLVALLSLYGISAELALAFSFLLLARNILFGLTGGLLEAFNTIRRRRVI